MTTKKLVLSVFLAIVILGLVFVFLPVGRNHTNPPVTGEPKWDSPATRQQFMTSCGDCHSNESVWPWYSNLNPVSWLIQRDVDQGRSRLNVSEWNTGRHRGGEAASKVQEGEMPLPIYLIMHPNARMNQQQKDTFVQGLIATFGAGE